MSLTSFLSIALTLLICVSCGKKSSNASIRETQMEENDIGHVLNNQKFDCASLGGPCPIGISRLFIVNTENPNHSSVCSGFMIGANRLVTNHHCVSTALQCKTTFIAIYTGDGYQKSRCRRIIRSEEDVSDPNDTTRKIDYTLMETEGQYAGSTFPLASQLALPGDILDVWVVDHTGLDESPSNLLEARITEFHCEVDDQNTYQSLMAIKCPIISGNSGSPALNQNGEVVAVAWGGTANDIDSSYPLELRRKLNDVTLFTEVNYFTP